MDASDHSGHGRSHASDVGGRRVPASDCSATDPGRRVAVIGETGSGKSTLVHLLMRFRDPTAGCIRLGDVDVRDFGESDLRRHISVVAQQPHMFNATLRENLLLARPGAGDDELLDALNSAQLRDFVTALPDGLGTWIGESAKLLSGGQARRVAVARAILHNAPLWVLDEPTEGLDPVTEGRMMAALKTAMVKGTATEIKMVTRMVTRMVPMVAAIRTAIRTVIRTAIRTL